MRNRLGSIFAIGILITSISYGISVAASQSDSRNPSNNGVACTVTQSSKSAPNSSSRASTCSPTITSISPNFGSTIPGATVNIYGSNLSSVTSVHFGDRSNAPFTKTATFLQVTSPGASNPGAVNVVVNSPSGSFNVSGGYTFYAPPTITSVTPNTGTNFGGTEVQITGTNLATVYSVQFGGSAATVTVAGDSFATVMTPTAATTGLVDISLTTRGGTVTYINGFTYITPVTPFSMRVGVFDNDPSAVNPINLPGPVSFDICEVGNLANCVTLNSTNSPNSVLQLNLSSPNRYLSVTYHNNDVSGVNRMYLFGITKMGSALTDYIPACCSPQINFTSDGQQAISNDVYSNSSQISSLMIFSNKLNP